MLQREAGLLELFEVRKSTRVVADVDLRRSCSITKTGVRIIERLVHCVVVVLPFSAVGVLPANAALSCSLGSCRRL